MRAQIHYGKKSSVCHRLAILRAVLQEHVAHCHHVSAETHQGLRFGLSLRHLLGKVCSSGVIACW